MKNWIFCLCIAGISTLLPAQNVSLDDVFSGKFSTRGVRGGASMLDGEHYTLITAQGIEKYNYRSSEKVGMIKTGTYDDYWFNSDESWLILQTQTEQIYRHSRRAVYKLYHMATGKEFLVFEGRRIMEPTLSPDGTLVAFAYENNLYVQKIDNQEVTQLTFDGEENKILNGINDWVYEEEFGFVRSFDWSPNSREIAYLRLDESEVPEMQIDVYGNDLYPSQMRFKYPKAGDPNSKVSVHTTDLTGKVCKKLQLTEYTDYYIPKVKYSNKANELVVLVSNRHQNQVDFLMVNTVNMQAKKLFTETDKAWIETDHFDLHFLDDNSFLWSSERDGYRHLYHYASDGKLKRQITKGAWEVTSFYGVHPNGKKVYFQSTEPGSSNRGIYSIGIDGKNKTNLTPAAGVNNANFSHNFQYFINSHAQANKVPVYTLNDGQNGKTIKVLQDNSSADTHWQQANFSPKEFLTIPVNGTELNAYLIKPKDFDPTKKYPVFMYLYGGPGSQQVLNTDGGFYFWWFQHLASQGYIIACVDNRGTGGKGADFKKVTYKNLGHYELQDQIAAAQYLGQQTYIDADRIGIFGWSFGGYMSSLALTKGADTFKLGIAVAPVTNWRYYDTIYTERFLQTPQENPEGYDQNSPIHYADMLKGHYLLVHGTADDNVHVQNAMQMAEALIQANKDFEYMVYPDKNHGIYGGNTRRHLFRKMTNFILENL